MLTKDFTEQPGITGEAQSSEASSSSGTVGRLRPLTCASREPGRGPHTEGFCMSSGEISSISGMRWPHPALTSAVKEVRRAVGSGDGTDSHQEGLCKSSGEVSSISDK
mmetsp:Transcript_17065/g.45487  ORF Transcript_17065/g.45487 Transcript_17065/m.45487 type:complete len:108 (+) Transcript_17065:1239-1562(+)